MKGEGLFKTRKPFSYLRGFPLKDRATTYSPTISSTIGADGLNFSVRNGKRWNPAAIVTLRLSNSDCGFVISDFLPSSVFRLPASKYFNILAKKN